MSVRKIYFSTILLTCLLSACGGAAQVGGDEISVSLPPEISLVGSDNITITTGSTFNDPGATANDAEDGNISNAISIESSLDTSIAGEYEIIYSVTDSDGNITSVTRNVTVISNSENDTPTGSETPSDSETPTDTGSESESESEPLKPATRADAARFLNRATFGVKEQEANRLLSIGYAAWIDEQMSIPATLQLPALIERMTANGFQTTDVQDPSSAFLVNFLRLDAWFDAVTNQPDQLRQRVAFALSQVFVISTRTDQTASRIQGVANFNDILVRNAFGNYRTLLEEVTLNPIMGNYLSMRRNEKANVALNIQPDENYAREVMQLFSIGLDLLNWNGTVTLDSNNQAIPTYTQTDINNFARVFTGWNYFDSPSLRSNDRTLQSEISPMTSFDEFHDTDSKTLLRGELVPAGNTAEQDLKVALDNIFNHPNVGPFISKQLIQKLVTSNPAPDYVGRVAAVFNDNGQGVRGDLGATIKAILMDQDALVGHSKNPNTFGKLKEPLIKFTNIFRAFNADGVVPGRIRFAATDRTFSQQHMASPSVFNFFQPDYSQPGRLRDENLASPEFQILDESTAVNIHNELHWLSQSTSFQGNSLNTSKNQIILNIDLEKTMANDAETLVDHLIEKLIGRDIGTESRQALIDYIAAININDDGFNRTVEAIYMISMTPEFSIQR